MLTFTDEKELSIGQGSGNLLIQKKVVPSKAGRLNLVSFWNSLLPGKQRKNSF
jgi:hypothetical protein